MLRNGRLIDREHLMTSKRTLSKSERHDIRERFLNVDTANVADVLDHLGMLDQGLAPAFQPFPTTCGKLAG
jgi:4-hydroxy-4-methyl-2-oxoglutarate aldolase